MSRFLGRRRRGEAEVTDRVSADVYEMHNNPMAQPPEGETSEPEDKFDDAIGLSDAFRSPRPRVAWASHTRGRLSTHLSKKDANRTFHMFKTRIKRETKIAHRKVCLLMCTTKRGAEDDEDKDVAESDDKPVPSLPILVTDTDVMKQSWTDNEKLKEEAQIGLEFVRAVVRSRQINTASHNVTRPRLIISVTGGARAFHLSETLKQAIEDGLRRAADSTAAWIITGGTNCGVMQLTGELMANINEGRDRSVPVIGIATYGILNPSLRQKLEGQRETFDYAEGGFDTLNHNHNLFILVNDGTTGDFGREIPFRAQLEDLATKRFNCPAVVVVVQGGPGTLDTALQAVKHNTPVVVVRGTGQVADLVAEAWDFTHSDSLEARTSSIEDLIMSWRRSFPNADDDKIKKWVADSLECVQDRTKVVVWESTSKRPLDEAIFQAAFTGSSSTFESRLNLAIYVRDPSKGEALIREAENADSKTAKVDKETLDKAKHSALLLALKLGQRDFVEMLLKNGAKLHKLFPGGEQGLFGEARKQPAGPTRPSNAGAIGQSTSTETSDTADSSTDGSPARSFVSAQSQVSSSQDPHRPSNLSTSTQFSRVESDDGYTYYNVKHDGSHELFQALRELYLAEISKHGSHLQRLYSKHIVASAVSRPEDCKVGDVEATLASLVEDHVELDRQYEQEEFDKWPKKKKENTAAHSLLLWAIATNKFAMARLMWQHGDQQIANALMASRLFEKLAAHPSTAGESFSDLRAEMRENSKKFGQLALRLLEVCQATDSLKTTDLLTAPVDVWRGRNCENTLQISSRTDINIFKDRRMVNSLLDPIWYGKLDPENNPPYKIVLWVLLPFLALFWPSASPKALKETLPKAKAISDVYQQQDHHHAVRPGHADSKISAWIRFRWAFEAPYTRFLVDAMSHLALCIVFSWMLMDRFDDSLSALEYLILAWMFSLFVEEIRQTKFYKGLFGSDRFEGWSYVKDWAKDPWNILDSLIIAVYIIGFAVRAADPSDFKHKVGSKNILGVTAIMLWVHLARFYVVSETLGPKVVMAFRMMTNLLSFILLLAVCLIGFSVASYVALFPDRPFSRSSVPRALFRPVFNVFGEPLLEDLREDAQCLTLPFGHCNEGAFMSAVYLAVFMLVSNVLLLNLLIAMFNRTYQEIEENAFQVWTTQYHALSQEYQQKPRLPPPIILVEHCYRLVRDTCFATLRKIQTTDEQQLKSVKKFEANCMQKFLEDEAESSNTLAMQTNQRLDEHAELLFRLEGSVQRVQAAMYSSTTDHLNPNNGVDQQAGSKDQSQRHIASVFPKMLKKQASIDESTGARKTGSEERASAATAFFKPFEFEETYPKSSEKRAVVLEPDWRVECGYEPHEFTASFVSGAEWADPDDPTKCQFNVAYDKQGIVRFSAAAARKDMDGYEIRDGRPLNPHGRTGISGRGQLGKWGVNFAIDTIVTRWRRDESGNPFEREGKPVLEFIGIRRKDTLGWATPGGFLNKHETFEEAHVREFMEEAQNLLKREQVQKEDKEYMKKFIGETQELIYEGYAQDQRNTDNAWIETHVVNCHDELHKLKINLEGGDDACDAQWLMVHRAIRLFAGQERYMREIARLHNAYW